MAAKTKPKTIRIFAWRKLTTFELRTLGFVATILLAAFAIYHDVSEPIVWTFLVTAITLALTGRTAQ